jgi:hypothetical protein
MFAMYIVEHILINMPKAESISLPHKIVVIPNKDKKQNEKWTPGRKAYNFPCPNRFILCGRPGTGKSLVLQNILLRARPMFDVVVLVHPDGEVSREWDDFEPTYTMEEPPDQAFFEQLVDEKGNFPKTAVVIDDIELFHQRKEVLANIASLMRYYSTHRYVSTFLTFQSFFDIDPLFRKLASVFILWKPLVNGEITIMEDRLGMQKGMLSYLFDSLCPDPKDFIIVDHSQNSPMPLRCGLFKKIELDEGDSEGDEDG